MLKSDRKSIAIAIPIPTPKIHCAPNPISASPPARRNGRAFQRSPDLVIEILSPSTRQRDLGIRRSLCAKYGVREYWIVDPDAKTVEVLSLTETGYCTVVIVPQTGTLNSPLFPAVNLAVTQPSAQGNIRLYPADEALPTTSSVNYASGQTRANNAIVGLSPAGALAIRCSQGSGTAHVVLDVTGYFE